MYWRAVPVAAALLFSSAEVRATCPKNSIPGAVSARLDASAIGILETVLVSEMPSSIPVPTTPYTVMECPDGFDDTIVTPLSGDIAIDLRSLNLSLMSGALEVDATLDVDVATMLQMQLCAMPDATCPATLSAQSVKVHARIEPSVASCAPKLPVTDVQILVDPYTTEIHLDSCGLYDDVFALIYDWFRDTIVNMIVEKLDQAISTDLPDLLETTVLKLVADGVDVQGLHFDVAAESVVMDPRGVVVRFAANVTPTGGVAPCLPKDASLPQEVMTDPAPEPEGDALLGLTLSQPFIQRAVRAAWLSGWLCFDTRDYDLDLSEVLAPPPAQR